MKTLFNAEEIRLITDECEACEHCSPPYQYCNRHRTDSPVFKCVRCENIKKLINEKQ